MDVINMIREIDWNELNIQQKIIEILRETPEDVRDHHFGRPFLTAYQIAIEYANRYPEDVERLEKQIGGSGTGEYTSLAQSFANTLSIKIKSGHIQNIEGRFLSARHIREMIFENDIRASNIESKKQLSLFRLR